MKRCPRCDFDFADFHRVCDFDGTALLDDPERPPSFVNDRSPRTRFRPVLKSPLFVDGLAGVALLVSALLIGYYQSPRESTATATLQPSQNAFVSPVTTAQDSTWPPAQRQAQMKAQAASTRAPVPSNSKRAEKSSSLARRQATAPRQLARLNSPGSGGNQPRTSTAARQSEPEDAANRKEPKLTAMLKTTWRVLKKPFKF